ncbi:F-box domain-containing protein [Dioscorea alata]|uniref:F-box domain-containing protein n=1 Tax=Dioscorea alata TaxID=55571 RepID=A0ACB7U025_DIOAL|nr:F-box domain-containing protein [Dioscorea alata]
MQQYYKMTTTAPKNPDWSAIDELALSMISGHLNAVDHINFRCVCTSWHAASPKRPQIPLIVTCNVSYSGHLSSLDFYDLVRNQNIPLSLTARNALSSLLCTVYKYIGCSHGWIFLAAIRTRPVIISFLNPFTGQKVTLPGMKKVKLSPIKCPRVVLSLPVVVYYSLFPRDLRFIRFGETTWKRIELSSPLGDVTAFKGRFYGHYCSGRNRNKLYLIDLEANNGNGDVVHVQLELPDMLSGEVLTWKFLIEFSGDLLVAISRLNSGHKYEFLKVDFENGLLQMLPEIGGHVLFLGENLPVLVPPERLLDFIPDLCHFPENPNALSVYDSYQLGRILSLKGNLEDRSQSRVAAGWITPLLF